MVKGLRVGDAQLLLDRIYGVRDRARGVGETFAWLVSEVGELAECLSKNKQPENLEEEAADDLAWLLSLCNIPEIDIEKALVKKYG